MTSLMPLIYIAEDEADLASLVASELESFGYRVSCFGDGRSLLESFRRQPADICLIDLGLPDMDGLRCLRELSEQSLSGLIVMTGRGGLADRVLGLELGADDYLIKPFAPRELIARVQSLSRRLQNGASAPPRRNRMLACFGNWQFEPATLLLSGRKQSDGEEEQHTLSNGEANLLTSLLKAPGRILSREQLVNDQTIPYDRSIDSRMSRLRKKLEADPRNPTVIKTLYGAGYMLACKVKWEEREDQGTP